MNTSTSKSIDFQTIFLKTVSAALFMLAFYGITKAQTTYTFTGEMDERYENPANWTPTYPGTEIADGSIVFIEGAATANTNLLVKGTLHIAVGASLLIDSADLSIQNSGKLMNDGEITAASVRNAGMINNNFAATLHAASFTGSHGSMTNNLMSAAISIDGNLHNNGVFNNYSTCTVAGNFTNTFSFNEMRNSEMKIAGQHIEQLFSERHHLTDESR